ncbi:MAG: hypothetical protein NWE99_09700 [Candidatus Bathyarchaeota archaeon]|nr:hypothetical protein [Candidatus Bathyarchaeota archaeon]
MESADEYVAILSELGLNKTQARVYLTLAKAKNLSAKEIAEISKVARPDVYRALYQLEKIGLAETLLGEPMYFEAVPIDECFSTLLLERTKKTAELKEKAQKLTQNFKKNLQDKEVDEEFQFMLIPRKVAVYSKVRRMIEAAQERVCLLALMRRTLTWFSEYSYLVEEALARKVEFRVIIQKPKKDLWKPLKSLGKYPNFYLRLSPRAPQTAFSVWDRKELLMSTSLTDTASSAAILWSNNKGIVNLCQDYFEYLWRKAEKIDL